MNDPISIVLEKLESVADQGGGQWHARCPAHDDNTASLSIKQGDDGRVLLNCHAGCKAADIAHAIGLKMADLFAKGDDNAAAPKKPIKVKKVHPTLDRAIDAVKWSVEKNENCPAEYAAKWAYYDAGGTASLWIIRFNLAKTKPNSTKAVKTFVPVHAVAGGFSAGDPKGKLPLYRLRQIGESADDVVVVEGEKCAEAAASIGLNATTSAHGAKSAQKTDWSPLAGRSVILIPDAGDAGDQYIHTVEKQLAKLDPMPSVRVARLPDLAEGEDIVEWIERFRQDVSDDDAVARDAIFTLATVRDDEPTDEELQSEPESEPVDLVPLGERDPLTGKLVLSPAKTLPTAIAFIKDFHKHDDGRTLHSYAGQLITWHRNRYVEVEDGAIQKRLQPWLHDALRYTKNRDGEMELIGFDSNPRTVDAAVTTIRHHCHLSSKLTPPLWLNKFDGQPSPKILLPFPSGTLNVVTRDVLPPTPSLFNVNAIDFDYNPDADPPERFINFLEQLWGDDVQSTDLLMEFIGYCLVGDITQQKMLFIQGPKRAGKGTLGRLIKKLVGGRNVVAPTTESLAITFGLQPLIGKSVAIISDANFVGSGIGTVVERLKTISGADEVTIHRKHQDALTMTLPTRFIILSNELPNMKDASGALASRFMILQLTKTFFGVEDTTLDQQLHAELPGILNMAIEGYRRLMERGRFLQPDSVMDAVQEMHDLASPVSAFIRECCIFEKNAAVPVDEVWAAWQVHCQDENIESVGTKDVFCRNLYASEAGLRRQQLTIGERRVRHVGGIRLKLAIQQAAQHKENARKQQSLYAS